MAQCTAPIRGHRTAAAAAACPVCGGRRSYYHQIGYNTYQSFPSEHPRASNNSLSSGASNGGMKRKAKWSPAGSTVLYSPAQIMTLTPVRDNIVNKQKYRKNVICSYVMLGMTGRELRRSYVINSLQKVSLFGSVKKIFRWALLCYVRLTKGLLSHVQELF